MSSGENLERVRANLAAAIEQLQVERTKLQSAEGDDNSKDVLELHRASLALIEAQLSFHRAKVDLIDRKDISESAIFALLNGGDARIMQVQREIDQLQNETNRLQRKLYPVDVKNFMNARATSEHLTEVAELLSVWRQTRTPETRQSIDKIICGLGTTEGQNINCFVTRYHALARGSTDFDVYETQHSKSCRVSHLRAYQSSGCDVPTFTRMMLEQIVAAYPTLGASDQEIDVALEDCIYPQIYDTCLLVASQPKDDTLYQQQCLKYTAVSQAQMHIESRLRSPEIIPFAAPIAKIKSLVLSFSPSRMLLCIHDAMLQAMHALEKLQPGKDIGADDFVPVWIYIVLKANVRQLCSYISFVMTFVDDRKLLGALGFGLSSLAMAKDYILKLQPEQLARDVESAGKPFLVAERERYRSMAQRDDKFTVIKECEKLEGYRLSVVEQWVFKPTQFYATIIVKTDNPSDCIFVAIIQLNSSVSAGQSAFMDTIFFNPISTSCRAEATTLGTILLTDVQKLDAALTVTPIPSGDYEAHVHTLELGIALKRMKCGTPEHFDLAAAEEAFWSQYGMPRDVSIATAVQTLITEIHILLAHLDSLPAVIPIAGKYTDILLASVMAFQTAWNKSEDNPIRLAVDGCMTPELLSILRAMNEDFRIKLELLSFQTVDHVARHMEYQEIIKQFQKAAGDIQDGRIGKKNAISLNRLISQSYPDLRISPPDLLRKPRAPLPRVLQYVERREIGSAYMPTDPTTMSVADVDTLWPRSERLPLTAYLNMHLANSPTLGDRIPINPGLGSELLRALQDGTVLITLLHLAYPTLIDRRVVIQAPTTSAHLAANLRLCESVIKTLGYVFVDSRPLIENILSPMALRSLTQGAVVCSIFSLVDKASSGNAGAEGSVSSSHDILIAWLNSQIAPLRIYNLTTDLVNAMPLILLLCKLDTSLVPPATDASLEERALWIVHSATKPTIACADFVSVEAILQGNSTILTLFVGAIYVSHRISDARSGEIRGFREEWTIRAWLNEILEVNAIFSIFSDLRSGTALLRVVDRLYPAAVDAKEIIFHPSGIYDRLHNWLYLLDLCRGPLFMELPGITAKGMADGNAQMTMEFMQKFMTYAMRKSLSHASEVHVDDSLLVKWANRVVVAGGNQTQIKSLAEFSLSSCRYYADMLHAIAPQMMDYARIGTGNDDSTRVDNARYILTVARQLGCPHLFVFPQDLVEISSTAVSVLLTSLLKRYLHRNV